MKSSAVFIYDFRRSYIAGIFLLLALSCKFEGTGTPEIDSDRDNNPPNIVWIVGENLNLDLGIYGESLVATPHLDSLGKNGMVYTHVFSTSPVCAPSRSAFMTGMYQTTTGTHNMRSHREDDYRLPDGVRPVTHRLNDAGFYTANITNIGDRIVGTGKLDLNFVNEGPLYDSEYQDKEGRSVNNHGLPRFRSATFSSTYPFGLVTLSDQQMPVKVRLLGYNPLIPGDADASGIPMAILQYEVENLTEGELRVSIAGSMRNFIGKDGREVQLDWKGDQTPIGAVDNRKTFREDEQVRGIYM